MMISPLETRRRRGRWGRVLRCLHEEESLEFIKMGKGCVTFSLFDYGQIG